MPGQNNTNQSSSPFEIVTSSKSKKGGKGLVIAIIVAVFLILSVVAGVLLVRQRQNIQEKAVVPQCPAAEQCPVTQDATHLRSCDFINSDNSPDEQLCNSQRAGIISSCGGVKYCCPSIGANWTTNVSLCPAPKAGSYCQANWQCPTGSTCVIPAGDDAGACSGASPSPAGSPSPTPDLQNDPNNCGSIGNSCPGGTTCEAGQCVLSTASPTPSPTVTPGGTPNLQSDSNNCGSIGNVCSTTQRCESGVCTVLSAGTTPAPTSAAVQTSPRPVPVTGIDWPTTAGIGVGAAAIILSILLAL